MGEARAGAIIFRHRKDREKKGELSRFTRMKTSA
jgi:hypothetical protein